MHTLYVNFLSPLYMCICVNSFENFVCAGMPENNTPEESK